MSTSALILMLAVQISVVSITGYLYWKVMHIEKKGEKKPEVSRE